MFESYTSSGKVFKKTVVALSAVVIVVAVSLFFFLNNNSIKKSKAAIEQAVLLDISPQTVQVSKNQEFISTVKIGNMTRTVNAQGYQVYGVFNNDELQVTHIEYKMGGVSTSLGQTDTSLAEINSTGILYLQGEIASATPKILVQNDPLVVVTYKVIDDSFTTSRVVYAGDIIEVQSDGTLRDLSMPSKTLTIQNKAITGTPSVVGDTTLNMSLRFQGIPSIPNKGPVDKPMHVQVKVVGSFLSEPITDDVVFTSSSTGVWTGKMTFDLLSSSVSSSSSGTAGKYSIFIKGPKHLKKRVCETTPTESIPGSYACATDGIVLRSGTNTIDMTGILQMTGDLPVDAEGQNGLVDSADTSFISLNLGSSDTDVLDIGDLNLDGYIDTQDFSLIIASLKIKYDDPEE